MVVGHERELGLLFRYWKRFPDVHARQKNRLTVRLHRLRWMLWYELAWREHRAKMSWALADIAQLEAGPPLHPETEKHAVFRGSWVGYQRCLENWHECLRLAATNRWTHRMVLRSRGFSILCRKPLNSGWRDGG